MNALTQADIIHAMHDRGAFLLLKGKLDKKTGEWNAKASVSNKVSATPSAAIKHLEQSTADRPRHIGIRPASIGFARMDVDEAGEALAEKVIDAFGKPFHRYDNPNKPGHCGLDYRITGDTPPGKNYGDWETRTDQVQGIVLWDLAGFWRDFTATYQGDVPSSAIAEFCKAHGGKGKVGRPKRTTRARNRNNALRSLLKKIDGRWPVQNEEDWRNVGMALRVELADEKEGWRIFDKWSRGGDDGPEPRNYDHKENRARWRSFKTEGERLITLATVLKMAEDHDPSFRREFEAGELTELAMSKRLVAGWEKRFVYVTDDTSKTGNWARWQDHQYLERDAQPRVQLAVREMQDDVLAGGGPKRELAATQTRRFARALEGYASDMLSSARGYFDARKGVLNTPTGVLDLETFEVQPHEEPGPFLKSTAVSPDPAGGCPVWKSALEAWQPDTEVRAFLQRVAGYSLLGHNQEHALIFLLGEGGNGKSAFMDTLENVLGDYAGPIDKSAFLSGRNESHPTALADMHGKRLAIVSEVEHAAEWSETAIKRATGDRRIKARRMHENFYTFDMQALPVVVANHAPALRHADDAMRRRLHLVEFSATFKSSPEEGELQADVTLAKRMAGEYPAIMTWMLDGLRSYYKMGLSPPAAVTQRTEDYFGEQDAIGEFLRQECHLVADGTVGARNLYQTYAEWAHEEGGKPLGSRRFGEAMNTRARRNLGIDRVKTKRGWFYRGVQTQAPVSLVGNPLAKEIEALGTPAEAAQHDGSY